MKSKKPLRKTATKKTPRRHRKAVPVRQSRKNSEGRIRNFFLPAFLSLCILICLGTLGFLGYQRATASDFFDVSSVEVRGVGRASRQDIERIVRAQAEKSGVWNADLPAIRESVEKLTFVKSAAVSRVLPNRVRVMLVERVPVVRARLTSGDVLVDDEGRILAPVEKSTNNLPVVLIGWDEEKSERADKNNLERVRLFQKMMAEWQQLGIAARIRFVNLTDLREPKAVTEDSGKLVSIGLGHDNFTEHLKMGIRAITGKGETFEAVNLVGGNMILAPREK